MDYFLSDRVQTLKPSAIREIFKYAADPEVYLFLPATLTLKLFLLRKLRKFLMMYLQIVLLMHFNIALQRDMYLSAMPSRTI